MTRAKAEQSLRRGTLTPQEALDDPDGYPNRHVRLRAFKMTGQEGSEEALKTISKEAAELKASQGELPRWIQKFLAPQSL